MLLADHVDRAHAIAGYVTLAILCIYFAVIFWYLWTKGQDGPFS